MKKNLGQVFTPDWVVNNMLNSVDYSGNHILNKKILEPSAGDGAFVKEIIERYIKVSRVNGFNNEEIKKLLEEHIYAFELDKDLFIKLNKNADMVASKFGIENVNWNFYNHNTLKEFILFQDFFDFIVGNPPYVRVHLISEEERNYIRETFEICKEGTMDIYFAFFEAGYKMLKKDGFLSYITPNTFMRTRTGERLRNWMIESRDLIRLVDFKGKQVFNESTFTSISTLQKGANVNSFKVFNGEQDFSELEEISYTEAKSRAWDFYTLEDNLFLKKHIEGKSKIGDIYEVQCAICTLRDKLYISKVEVVQDELALFNGIFIEKDILKPVEKATKYNGQRSNLFLLFPYHMEGEYYKPFEEEYFKSKYPRAYAYLESHKEDLDKRDADTKDFWYVFGRSQGIKNSLKPKLLFKSIVPNNLDSLNVHIVSEDIFIYSGIYITGPNLEGLKTILEGEEFAKYLSLRGLNKAGGYKEINTKMIKNFCIDEYNLV